MTGGKESQTAGMVVWPSLWANLESKPPLGEVLCHAQPCPAIGWWQLAERAVSVSVGVGKKGQQMGPLVNYAFC